MPGDSGTVPFKIKSTKKQIIYHATLAERDDKSSDYKMSTLIVGLNKLRLILPALIHFKLQRMTTF